MQVPANPFLAALRAGRPQFGCWLALADPYSAEIVGGAGFDCVVIDGEHAPNDLRSVLAQLQALAPYPTHPIVRLVQADVALVKQLLDIGAQTLLVPMIDTVEQAERMASAMHYPPRGVRGVGASIARASRWGRVEDYLRRAGQEVCLVVQVESRTGLSNLRGIASVDGVDAVFFGPSDLAASMGHLGEPRHPDVHRALLEGIATVRGCGKAAAILTFDPDLVREYLDAGATFVAVAADTSLLRQAATTLAASYRR